MSSAPTNLRSTFNRRDMMTAGFSAGVAAALSSVSRAWGQQQTSSKWFQIVDIKRTTVKLPYRETSGRNMARELPHWAWTEICEVELKSGKSGFGETLLYYTYGATDDDDVQRARGGNAVELMWDDSLGAGLQMALFHAVANTAEVPVYHLLGTKVHQTTPLAWWNIDTSPEDMAAECVEAQRQGYRAYKSKGRPWFDVWAQCEAVSRAVPSSFHLTLDFNDTLLDADRGIPILKELERYPQVTIWETPIFQSDIKGNQAIRRECRAPVAMHYGNPDPLVALREDVCDGFVIGGGAKRIISQATVAAMADKPFWLQIVGTGITAAWSLHFGAVCSHATWPAVNCHQLYKHNLLTEPIKLSDGHATVPDKVGLGYELDRDLIEKYKVPKPKHRPDPPRLIETSWKNGRKLYTANSGKVNFMLNAAQKEGRFPYFEKGVTTRLIANDGSAQWKVQYEQARRAPFMTDA